MTGLVARHIDSAPRNEFAYALDADVRARLKELGFECGGRSVDGESAFQRAGDQTFCLRLTSGGNLGGSVRSYGDVVLDVLKGNQWVEQGTMSRERFVRAEDPVTELYEQGRVAAQPKPRA